VPDFQLQENLYWLSARCRVCKVRQMSLCR